MLVLVPGSARRIWTISNIVAEIRKPMRKEAENVHRKNPIFMIIAATQSLPPIMQQRWAVGTANSISFGLGPRSYGDTRKL
jgi:hypothetical protein